MDLDPHRRQYARGIFPSRGRAGSINPKRTPQRQHFLANKYRGIAQQIAMASNAAATGQAACRKSFKFSYS